MRLHAVVAALLVACSSGEKRPRSEPQPLPTMPEPSEGADAPADPGSAEPAASAGPPDPYPRIARAMFPADLDPRRARVAWLPSQKAFLYAGGQRDAENRSSLTLVVAGTDPKAARTIEVCAADVCPTEAGRSKLDAALRGAGLEEAIVLESLQFPFPPEPKHEVTAGALAARVRWAKDHLQVVRKQKVAKLPPIEAADRAQALPVSIAVAPNGSLLAFTYAVGKPGDPNAPIKTIVQAVPPP
jgi:hypothetical protein